MSLVELALATNAQLRPGGEVLHKQVRRAWNVLCIFFRRNSTRPPVMLQTTPISHPRDPFQSPLWNILHNNKEGTLRPGDNTPEKEDSVDFTILDVSDYDPPHVPSKTCRELIKKVWEVDPLTCPRCGSEMRIINLIRILT